MGLSYRLGISRFVPAKAKFFSVIFWPYNKAFIDQACSIKMAEYWPRSFFAFLLTYSSRSIKRKKKELGHYPAILTSRLVNNLYVLVRIAQCRACSVLGLSSQ